jgi:signal transduction histidine kinase
VELAHGRALGSSHGTAHSRTVRATRRRQPLGTARIAIACGAASLLPLASLAVVVILQPRAPAASLLWLLIGLTVVATGFAGLTGLVISQPQLRSISLLQRIAQRALGGDPPGGAVPQVSPELRPLADDLFELSEALEEARAEVGRLSRALRVFADGREALVSSLVVANRRLRDEASNIQDFVETVNRPLDREQMCLQLLHALDDEVAYVEALIYLTDPETGRLRLAAACDRDRNVRLAGRYLQQLPNYSAEVISSRSLPSVVYQTGHSILVSDSQVDRRFVGLNESLRSFLAVPIEVESRMIGALQVGAVEPDRYDDHNERQVATLAHFAALWIDNLRLFQEAAKVEAFRKVDQLKSELLSTVSHELRTPLASIKGYASSLLREDVEWDHDTSREFLQIIDEEADRLTGLIEDLLQMSEIEAGVLRVDTQPVRVSKLAQKVVKKVRPQARNHTISVSASSDIPETMADPRRIEQVLHNLVVNAIKYSSEGTTVLVRVERRGPDVIVSVRDQGIGIPLEHQEHVFERFYRVDGTLARETRGSGLGLPICRGLVEAHGGKIWVESTANKGSTFYFTVPIVVPAVLAANQDGTESLAVVAADD